MRSLRRALSKSVVKLVEVGGWWTLFMKTEGIPAVTCSSLTILNAYIGPVQKHVVDAYEQPVSELITERDLIDKKV